MVGHLDTTSKCRHYQNAEYLVSMKSNLAWTWIMEFNSISCKNTDNCQLRLMLDVSCHISQTRSNAQSSWPKGVSEVSNVYSLLAEQLHSSHGWHCHRTVFESAGLNLMNGPFFRTRLTFPGAIICWNYSGFITSRPYFHVLITWRLYVHHHFGKFMWQLVCKFDIMENGISLVCVYNGTNTV